ncbi:uncharacterized protein [Onthophagus taurus]|uniref:uncharacterized protein n=1 Tax=Onthophagus taurus TaxID=166361 RepID=UPI0039BE7977
MSQLETLIKKRGIIKGKLTNFTKFVAKFEITIRDTGVDHDLSVELEQRYDRASNFIDEFEAIQGEIELLCVDGEAQSAERESFEAAFYSNFAKAKRMLSNRTICTDSSFVVGPKPEQNRSVCWVKFRQQLPYLNSIRVPRHISLQYSRSLELHGFSDASTKAYGACIYLRSCGVDGDVISRLICAKSRVAPLKQITVPRLELMGALLLADLMSKVTNALKVDILKTTYWTDSSVVLGWLSIDPSQLQIFVGNRVTKILERTNSNEWRYVSTKDNPADPISRGVNVRELSNLEKYWLGPAWLIQNENMWPVRKFQTENLPEKRVVLNLTTNVNQLIPFSKFSTLTKLQRIVAFVFRFKNNFKGKLRLKGPLNADELRVALEYLVRCSQRETFPEELQLLESDKCLPKKNRLTNLSAFLDENGIIRVGGRLSNSDYAFDKKFPIIISGKHTLTRLIFEAEHKFLFHAGPQQLLASIRKRFWPIGGRSIAKHIARKCITCCRVNPKFTQPRMGNLPKNRITPAPPFHTTGVDYAGPFLLKNKRGRGAKTSKCYICLFVCFVTRAIHLELVSELTSEAFLSALRRFAARRGKPQKMYSDNGTNFVGANRELEELSKFLINNSNELTDMINACNINWSFIPPNSPHFGGIWEAGVKSVKFHLRRVASNASFTFEDFYTLLVQIEAILNSRPLTPLSSDPNDLAPLTPAHFLIGKQLISPPDPYLSHVGENRLSHFQHIQRVQQHFWARWSRELQRRHKWTKSDSDLKIGQFMALLTRIAQQLDYGWCLTLLVQLPRDTRLMISKWLGPQYSPTYSARS